MKKLQVAIVGRPNVGKSTLFNKLCGKRISITVDTPGVTRDRIYQDAEWLGRTFTLIDTGGIEPDTEDVILSQMRKQAMVAINSADVVIFMLDGRVELSSEDIEVAQMLRRANKPVIVALNKIDSNKLPDHYYDYYQLGFGELFPISAINMLGLGDLLDEVISYADSDEFKTEDEDEVCKIAIVGKPNVGKSSLVNKLLGEERTIVSDIAGTTREAIDSEFTYQGEKFILIDTAGVRRKSKVEDDVERFSVMRAFEAVDRCDVCIIMIDATVGVTEQDKKIAGYAHEAGKASLLIVNKWDLIKKDNHTYKEYEKEVRNELSFMQYAPIEFISVVNAQRLDKLMELASYINNQAALRVKTGMLNEVLSDAILMHQPPSDKGKRLKLYYITQVGVKPPSFVLFVNDVELAHFSYIRYIENQIRRNFNFEGTPIKIEVRAKSQKMDLKGPKNS